MIHILHLSDIHLGTLSEALKYCTHVQADLKLELGIQQLDYLVISGDVANKSTPDEYDAAYSLISKLMERFAIKPDHVIVAPGNHDLNWDRAKAAYDFVRTGDSTAGVPEHYRIPAGTMGELVRNDDRYRQRFAHFGAFYEQITGTAYPLDFDQQALLHLFPDDRLLFLNLNSAWEVDDHYRERSGINMLALSSALDRLLDGDYDGWLKFAVWHHPVAGKEMIEDAFLEQLTVLGFHVCLHGHIHEAREGFYKYDKGRGIHIVGAGTFGAPTKAQTPGIPLQYNLLVLNPQTHTLTVKTRRKEKPDGAWMADARWGDKNNPCAWYELELRPLPSATSTVPPVVPSATPTVPPVVPSGQGVETDFADLELWDKLDISLPDFLICDGGILGLLPAAAAMLVWLLWIPPDESGIYFPVLTFVCLSICGLLFYLIYESRFFWWEDWWAQQVYRTSRISMGLLIAITVIGGLLFSMLWIFSYTSSGRPEGVLSRAVFALVYVAGFACLTAAVSLIVVNEYVEQLKKRAPAPIFVSTERLLRVVVEEAINSINLNGLGANTPVKCAGTNSVYEILQTLRIPENGGIQVLLRECKCVEYPTADGKPQGKLMEMLWRIQADRWGRVQVLRPGSLEPYSAERRTFREIGRYSY